MKSHVLLPVLTSAVFASALVFGGGARRDLLSDFIPQLLSIPLIVLAAPSALEKLSDDRLARGVLIAILALVVIHNIPLPPSLWSLLPGRELAIASFEAAGMPLPWMPISLHPAMGLKGAFALLPALSVFLGALSMSLGERRVLVLMVVVVGLVSVPLGILQLMGGRQFLFYAVTNPENAVGLFANRNHFAAFLFILIPMAASVLSQKGEVQGVPFWGALSFVWLVCLVGLATTGSRSALLLGALSVAGSFMLIVRPAFSQYLSGRRSKLGIIVVSSLVFVLLSAMGGARIFGRFESEAVDEGRLSLSTTTLDLAWRFFPFGSGLGSFDRIYEALAPSDALLAGIANHAHNDWAQALLETGPVGTLIGFAFVYWFIRKAIAAYHDANGDERMQTMGAALVVALLCIHSIWDYPLRTIALSCCLAISCAFLFKAPEEGAGLTLPKRRRRRHRRTRRLEEPAKDVVAQSDA